LKTLARGKIPEFSDAFNHTRHAALDRVVGEVRRGRANSVVGIRTTIQRWAGTHEMMMAGAAAFNPALPASAIVSSDLTGEELWVMTSLGYAPIKLLMSTAIYSLGLTGSFLAAFKSFTRGEISDLTRLVHDAREIAIDRLKSEADQLSAEDVVGVETYIAEIGHSLVEFIAMGTAVKKTVGVGVATPALPVQAIVPDKETWIDGDFGFQLDRTN
jgi:uncharacterized protein YbjQ (UPF0145 family)